MATVVERRRFRRADLDVSVAIRPVGEKGPVGEAVVGQLKNVSLAGIYCYVNAPCSLQVRQEVACSLAVPLEQVRFFPFTRLGGKGWIVRLDPITAGRRAGESRSEEQLIGVAIAFAPDVTALASIDF